MRVRPISVMECFLIGMVVLAGGITNIGMVTAAEGMSTSKMAQNEHNNTTMPETSSQQTMNSTTTQQQKPSGQGDQNEINITVAVNSTTLSGRNCSVSVATKGNITVPIVKSANETIETANVSAAWVVYTNRVEEVQKKVNQRIPQWVSNMSAVRSTSIGQSNNTTVQGRSVGVVVVNVAPDQVSEIQKEIPRQINCVGIIVRPAEEAVAAGDLSTVNSTDTAGENSSAATTSSRPTSSETTDTTETTTSSSSGSGFGVVAAIVALYTLMLLHWRR